MSRRRWPLALRRRSFRAESFTCPLVALALFRALPFRTERIGSKSPSGRTRFNERLAPNHSPRPASVVSDRASSPGRSAHSGGIAGAGASCRGGRVRSGGSAATYAGYAKAKEIEARCKISCIADDFRGVDSGLFGRKSADAVALPRCRHSRITCSRTSARACSAIGSSVKRLVLRARLIRAVAASMAW